MPIYEYVCKSCGALTEKLESINSEGKQTDCEKCGQVAERKISVSAFHLSGSGFHNTDYKGSCQTAKPDAPACAACPMSSKQ